MQSVGIRELRNQLSKYLETVEGGETIRVTRYDQEIARITPSDEKLPETLVGRMNQEGISWSIGKPRGANDPVTLNGSPASQAVVKNRR